MFAFEMVGSTLHLNTFTAVLAVLSSCQCLGNSAVAPNYEWLLLEARLMSPSFPLRRRPIEVRPRGRELSD